MKISYPAKKKYSQNFIIDDKILKKLADSIGKTELILEIGPADGRFTRFLSEKSKKMILVEKDIRFINELKNKYKKAEILNQDILKIDLSALNQPSGEITIAGNIPYNITGKIIEYLADNYKYIKAAYILVQKEVGVRLCAAAGTKEYGRPTVLLKRYYEIKKKHIVKAGSFYPKPKIDSMFIQLIKKNRINFETDEFNNFFSEIVKLCFSQRRKKLKKIIASNYKINNKIIDKIENNNINLDNRAEALLCEKFELLTKILLEDK